MDNSSQCPQVAAIPSYCSCISFYYLQKFLERNNGHFPSQQFAFSAYFHTLIQIYKAVFIYLSKNMKAIWQKRVCEESFILILYESNMAIWQKRLWGELYFESNMVKESVRRALFWSYVSVEVRWESSERNKWVIFWPWHNLKLWGKSIKKSYLVEFLLCANNNFVLKIKKQAKVRLIANSKPHGQ